MGTIFFISSFLPYVMKRRKGNKRAFYTETRIITIPNFIYRIRSNAKTLIMLTLLSAAVLTVSGVMALTVYYPIAAVSRIAPSEIEFRMEEETQLDNVKRIVSRYAPDETITFTQTEIYKAASSASVLPVEYGVGSAKGDAQNEKIVREPGFECISFTDYVTLLRAQGREGVIDSLPD